MPLFCVRVNYEFSRCVDAADANQAAEMALKDEVWSWDQVAVSPVEAELAEEEEDA